MHATCLSRFVLANVIAAIIASIAGNALAQPRLEPPEVDSGEASTLPPPAQPAREPTVATPTAAADLGAELDPEIHQYAVVRRIAPGGAADEAGLQVGDTIESISGTPVRSPRDVEQSLARLRPGDVVDIDFSRRITGRTQAVLESRTAESQPNTEQTRLVPRREPVDRASYEALPSPRPDARRSPPGAPARNSAQSSRYDQDEPEDQRDEPPRRGRLFNRNRALLPWRRN